MNHAGLGSLAAAKGRSVAEVCLQWNLQHGILSIPRTTHEDRMRTNLLPNAFTLTEEEMQAIDCLEPKEWSGKHPDTLPF